LQALDLKFRNLIRISVCDGQSLAIEEHPMQDGDGWLFCSPAGTNTEASL
jgi:hypothetical protein